MTERPEKPDRAKYWNEHYVAYWKERVAEANSAPGNDSRMVAGDARTTADSVYLEALAALGIRPTDHVLELGCGFGRSLPALSQAAARVSAVDISREMVETARRSCPATNVDFHVSSGEQLPFADASFDAVVCFATFDAMYQTDALLEISRVTRLEGRVLITGKNDNYHDDDDAALAAEEGARGKGHPNYFTDVGRLLANAGSFGFRIGAARYYGRRGDFAAGRVCMERPDRFYEYLLVLVRTGEACSVNGDFVVADERSKTHARRRGTAAR